METRTTGIRGSIRVALLQPLHNWLRNRHPQVERLARFVINPFRRRPVRPAPDSLGMIEIRGVRGYLIPGDVEHLYDCARRLPTGAVLVEVGSFMGLSSTILARGLRAQNNHTAKLYCVDTFEGSEEHRDLGVIRDGSLFDTWQKNVEREGVARWIEPIRSLSVEAATRFPDAAVDFIFIDAAHDYDSVRADLEAWWKKRKPSGLICGHDYLFEGVHRAVDEFAAARGATVHIVPGTNGIWEIT